LTDTISVNIEARVANNTSQLIHEAVSTVSLAGTLGGTVSCDTETSKIGIKTRITSGTSILVASNARTSSIISSDGTGNLGSTGVADTSSVTVVAVIASLANEEGTNTR
jgi:hypothetical protein